MNVVIALLTSLIVGYIISTMDVIYQPILLFIFVTLVILSYYKQFGWFKWEQKKNLLIVLIIGLFLGHIIGKLKILDQINNFIIGWIIVIFIISFIGYMGINNLLKNLKFKIYDKITIWWGYFYGICFTIISIFLLMGFIVSKEFELLPFILLLISFTISIMMIYLSYQLWKRAS